MLRGDHRHHHEPEGRREREREEYRRAAAEAADEGSGGGEAEERGDVAARPATVFAPRPTAPLPDEDEHRLVGDEGRDEGAGERERGDRGPAEREGGGQGKAELTVGSVLLREQRAAASARRREHGQ